jgi:ribosome-associated protein
MPYRSTAAELSAPGDNGSVSEPGQDLVVPPGPGLPRGLVLPAAELIERFSRSTGPGGQGVNTTDSRVELLFDPAGSAALSEEQRARVLAAFANRLAGGRISITASEFRSQLRNRAAARERLASMLREALVPPPPPRRPTRRTRSSQRRRLEMKRRRAETKARRGPVTPD